jgi:enoyl-CoA hydratase/carnithine racemase
MTIDGLHVTDRGAARWIELDRPASRNGVTQDIMRAIKNAIADTPDAIRVIAVAGRNGHFCSGLDLKDAMQRGIQPGPAVEAGLREDFHGVIRGLAQNPRPTVAVVDGAAAGYGCDLALACDIRLVSSRARFGEIFVRRGLMPDGGGTFHLPRIVGLGRALELLLTGDLIDAEEAFRIGLANRVFPIEDFEKKSAAYVELLAKGPPLVHRAVKRAVYAGLSDDLDAALDREATGQLQLLSSRDFAEGVMAFMQKRDPEFKGS